MFLSKFSHLIDNNRPSVTEERKTLEKWRKTKRKTKTTLGYWKTVSMERSKWVINVMSCLTLLAASFLAKKSQRN